jgi:SAM-dependent methyltransferase
LVVRRCANLRSTIKSALKVGGNLRNDEQAGNIESIGGLERPTARSYGAGYFTTLYGAAPAQTVADKLRDRLIRRMVYRYSRPGPLLEIGCGFGYFLALFDDRYACYGTDISAHAVAVARRRLPRARLVVSDVQDGIPFHGPFTSVVAVNVMEHLPEPERAVEAIAEHMTRGGIFVAHLPTISNPLSAWFYARSYARDRTHVYRPSGETFNELIAAAGLRLHRAMYFPFFPDALWRRLRPHPSYLAVFERPR